MSHFKVEYQKKELSPLVGKWGMILLALGLILVILSYATDPLRTGFNSVIGFAFILSIGLGSLFLVGLEHLAGAVWSVPFRRVAEILATLLFIAPLLAIPAYLNMHQMYHWMEIKVVAIDPVLKQKSPYLNLNFFVIRTIAMLVIMGLFYYIFTSGSLKQDSTGDKSYTTRSIRFSTVFMPFFAILLTAMAIDYIMSLEPHWFSTIFGVYYFAGTVWSSLAVLTIIVVKLNENGYLVKGINSDHYYSLGGLMFAFTAFWTYIAFSQFMLIYYANMPEETFWFVPRMTGGWGYLSVALIFLHFVIPFFLLIQRSSKTNPARLKFIGVWIICVHFYDLYWLVMPSYSRVSGNVNPVFSWNELAYPILCIGLIMTLFNYMSKSRNLVAIGDPKMERALDFHL